MIAHKFYTPDLRQPAGIAMITQSAPPTRLSSGPRIYNLFPLLAGPVTAWADHLDRIAGMGFDWIWVNPFHYPGFSGSLYAVKDPYRLHPLLAGDGADPAKLLKGFTSAAAKRGIAVMMDLVINHTAKDLVLATEHPEWFMRDANGELRSPRAVDPVDPRRFTVWGDLAEIDYHNPNVQPAQIAYWTELVTHHLKLGFKAFRCDAAYQVPTEVWQGIIGEAKAQAPACRFFAETLGCTPEQVLALKDAGFDYLFNSAKWWDFRAPWLLEQYDLYRQVAPTVAFPESHDTERLAMTLGDPEPDELEHRYRFHYLFAATFSSGVMIPMGFEYGCRKPMDVVGSRPGDWAWETERPRIDLTGYIGEVNRMKAATPALNVDGRQDRITAPHHPIIGLAHLSGGDLAASDDAAIVLINPDAARAWGTDPGPLINQSGGRISRFEDVTPDGPALPFEPGQPITLKPWSLRVFRGRAEPLKPPAPISKAAEQAAEKRLLTLARDRVVIERVEPELDGGRHAIKRVVGDIVEVEADIFCDGHDKIAACIKYRAQDEGTWHEAPMAFVDNDRWGGHFPLHRNRRYLYTIEAWRDLFESWRAEVMKKHDAGLDVALELIEGRTLIERTLEQAKGDDRKALAALMTQLDAQGDDHGRLLQIMLGEDVRALMQRAGIRTNASRYRSELEVFVDRPAAKFAAWYEMFPRSQSDDPHRHGTFDDVIRKLPYVRDMGFDVLYFTPIHPIGRTNRKGRNNTLTPGPDDPGSPYAIGSDEGGHDALASRARHVRGLSPAGRGGARSRPRDRARLRDPVLARPSLDQAASGVVRLAPGRHDQVRREPAQEVRGHRQRPLLPGRPARDLVRAARRRAVLGRPGRQDLPGRQPAHQAGAVLGMDDPRGARPAPRRDLPGRGVHPPEDDEAARQGRLHPVLLVLHLAQHQGRADRVPDRADPGRAQGVHAAELLRQHARHQPGAPADQRPGGLPEPPGAGRDPVHASTASTTASSCARARRSRARRSISIPRNTRSRPGTTTGPATSATTSPG